MTLFVCVGDVSADRHTARLLAHLKELAPDLRVWGVGGSEMEAQGAELIKRCQDFACVGIIEPIKLLPFFARLRAHIIDQVGKRRPGAALLVDFGGFNLNLAAALRTRYPELPIIYFISPQVWGSRPWRINAISRTVSRMLTIFPFEEALYRRRGINARFVGHPLAQELEHEQVSGDREAFLESLGLDPASPLIGIFPGSRRQEISGHMPVVLDAVRWLLQERPDLQFVISQANPIVSAMIGKQIDKRGMGTLIGRQLRLVDAVRNRELMQASDLLWTKSGTTTLEAALCAKPMLIFYRGNWLSFFIFLLFKQVKYVGWPNILAGRLVVPELLQLDCRPQMLVRYTRDWLEVPGLRHEIASALEGVRSLLGQGDFSANAAAEVLDVLRAQAASALEQETGLRSESPSGEVVSG